MFVARADSRWEVNGSAVLQIFSHDFRSSITNTAILELLGSLFPFISFQNFPLLRILSLQQYGLKGIHIFVGNRDQFLFVLREFKSTGNHSLDDFLLGEDLSTLYNSSTLKPFNGNQLGHGNEQS